ncbi:MAG TPA: polyprenol monophosphomannose synthase [Gemmataceae bacterium]|nr:polyprenol monophosphomannose synthase [Gemmataceae bacterium]
MQVPNAASPADFVSSNGQPAAAAAARLLVSLATYNEHDNLAALVHAIQQHAPHADILIIDDNSPDGTGQLADELAAHDSRIRVLHRPGKLGLGTALLAAMQYAMEHGYDFHLNMDADFSHPPGEIPHLLAGMSDHDVMIGSRYVTGGGTRNWPLPRKVISRSVNSMVRILFRMPVKDASGAFRCYRVAKLRETRLDLVKSRGYSFQQEVLYRCFRAGCRLGEHPIIFENRRAGASKVNMREAARSVSMLVWLGMRSWLRVD